MSRVSGRSSKAKRTGGHPKPVSAKQLRKVAKRSQLKIRKTTLEMKKVVSQRGRTHYMEAPLPGMPETPQKLTMESEVISKFKYDIPSKTLRIWFTSGQVYDYYNVPESVVMVLAQAQSKGRYFHDNIYGYWSGKPGSKVLHPDYQFRRIR